MNDSSIFLKNIVTYHNCDGLQLMLDEVNKILLTKERIIDELNAKIIELESNVKEDKSVIKEPRSQNNYETHIEEIRLLNVKL
jgi:predicted nucleic acid-binding protein